MESSHSIVFADINNTDTSIIIQDLEYLRVPTISLYCIISSQHVHLEFIVSLSPRIKYFCSLPFSFSHLVLVLFLNLLGRREEEPGEHGRIHGAHVLLKVMLVCLPADHEPSERRGERCNFEGGGRGRGRERRRGGGREGR